MLDSNFNFLTAICDPQMIKTTNNSIAISCDNTENGKLFNAALHDFLETLGISNVMSAKTGKIRFLTVPLTIINTPESTLKSSFNKIYLAHYMQAIFPEIPLNVTDQSKSLFEIGNDNINIQMATLSP